MYQEELIAKIKRQENVKRNYEQLYYSNYPLIISLSKTCGVRHDDLDDFLQLAFIALRNAIAAYEETSRFSFLSFFRRCLIHEYYVYKLSMHFPCRLTNGAYQKIKESTEGLYAVELESIELHQLDYAYSASERALASSVLWDTVAQVLSAENTYIIRKRFIEECTFCEIAKELGVGAECIRQREKKSLNKLRANKVIQELRADFWQ